MTKSLGCSHLKSNFFNFSKTVHRIGAINMKKFLPHLLLSVTSIITFAMLPHTGQFLASITATPYGRLANVLTEMTLNTASFIFNENSNLATMKQSFCDQKLMDADEALYRIQLGG